MLIGDIMNLIFRRSLIICTVTGFVLFIILGNKGVREYFSLKDEVIKQQAKIDSLEKQLLSLKEELGILKQDDFLVERQAREELLLGNRDEDIYIIE